MKRVNRYSNHFLCLAVLKNLMLSVFVLMLPAMLAAQDTQGTNDARSTNDALGTNDAQGARIFHVEGGDFALTIRGEQTIISAGDVPEGGINLERTGIVNTGAGSFVEIQLIPSGALIKLSENTSFMYNGIDETGKFADLGLLYGRIRLVVRGDSNAAGMSSAGANVVSLRSGGISTRMGEGDYGIDYVLESESGTAAQSNSMLHPLFRLNVFRGSAEVSPYGKGGTQIYSGGGRALSVGEGESLSLDISSSYTYAERNTLDKVVMDYWNVHNFTGVPPVNVIDAAIALSPSDAPFSAGSGSQQSGSSSSPAADNRDNSSAKNSSVSGSAAASGFNIAEITNQGTQVHKIGSSKNRILAFGLFLTVTSVAIQAVSFHIYNALDNSAARTMYNTAYMPLGLGILTTLTGILYNPSTSFK
ncbi:MAG: FecR family protein [Treponema sp.]|nr:FecR family protein [Treponema sp.]